MSLFRTLFLTALFAGVLSGLALTVIQQTSTVPLILKAEVYEKAAEAAPPAHDHEAAAPQEQAVANAEHEHDESEWEPADGFERMAFASLANILSSVGFALVLVGASELKGGLTSWREGMFWGLAGFAVFMLAPGLGLPPELPAIPAAPLEARQIWWVATAALTAGGLALIVFRREWFFALLGAGLIVLPHVIGAPQLDTVETPIPEGLLHSFVVAVVVSNLVFWLLAGALAGAFRPRLNAA